MSALPTKLQVVTGYGIGRVTASRNDKYREGDIVVNPFFPVAEYCVVPPDFLRTINSGSSGIALPEYLSSLGKSPGKTYSFEINRIISICKKLWMPWDGNRAADSRSSILCVQLTGALSVCIITIGVPGFTAWVGIEVLGDLKPGSNVFISAAASGVGMYAGQLAKLKGCRVIGSTGSDEKVIYIRCITGYY